MSKLAITIATQDHMDPGTAADLAQIRTRGIVIADRHHLTAGNKSVVFARAAFR